MAKQVQSQDDDAVSSLFEVEDVIAEGSISRICRARRVEDGRPVILKLAHNEPHSPSVWGGINHEYEMTRRLDASNVIRAYAIERHDGHPAIVLEDFGGCSLDDLQRERSMPLDEVLEIGIQVADALAAIHAGDIIHKDINPSNIVYNPRTRMAKVIDFGLSTYLTREQADIAGQSVLQGSLPYVSPEQTGRMNRAVDYRSDFYSLGATLYELLTGHQLFAVDEPVEWLHCHIARQPKPPHLVEPSVPRGLSDVVMKLLAKTAEERYMSAAGIKADLERCLKQWRSAGVITPFAPGSDDLPVRFQLPQRLYGREREVAALLESFERVSAGGAELVTVRGYSGIGKTCLVRELYKPVSARRGFFIAGKFEQLHRNVPYRAVAAALRMLVRQLLSEPEQRLAIWRERVDSALGANAALLLDLVPELELVLGAREPVIELSSHEAEARFNQTVLSFIRCFCTPEHPLVLFLDDLQWGDSASLNLLKVLLDREDAGYLLLIGAYRDNGITRGHSLTRTLERIAAAGVRVEELALAPLACEEMTEMLADALAAAQSDVAPLAELILEKTGGNPFFTEEFLTSLYQRRLIDLDAAARCWRWNLERIRQEEMTDNVVELMTAKLRQLPVEARHLLELGACIGTRFELGILLLVCEREPRTAWRQLRTAMSHGLIAPVSGGYQRLELHGSTDPSQLTLELAFAHDRIRQAAYALLDEEARRCVHLRIGRLLARRLSAEQRDSYIFEIVGHLNIAVDLIDDAREREELCRANLAAGRRAKNAAAYTTASGYFDVAISLLAGRDWEEAQELSVTLHGEAAEAAYLSGEYETSDRLVAAALPYAGHAMEWAKLHEVRLASLSARARYDEVLTIGKSLLAELGEPYPKRPRRIHWLLELVALQWRMRGMSSERLRALPVSHEPRVQAAMRIGERVAAAAAVAQRELLPLMIVRGVRMALEDGLAERSPQAFAGLGMMMYGAPRRLHRGRELGRVGLELCERFPGSRGRGRTLTVYAAHIQPWSEPLRACLEPLSQAYEICLQEGDVEGAAQAAMVCACHALASGLPLERVQPEIASWRAAVVGLRQEAVIEYIDCLQQFVACLRGEAPDPACLVGSSYDIRRMMPLHREAGAGPHMLVAQRSQAYLSYLFGDCTKALRHVDGIRAHARGLEGLYEGVSVYFTDALIRLALCRSAPPRRRRRLLRQTRRNRRVLARWAEHNPAACAAKAALVEAERLCVLGRESGAQARYDEAIRLARVYDMPLDEALANELAADMHQRMGRTTIAGAYLGKAREAYRQADVCAKVTDLERRHPELIEPRPSRGASFGTHGTIAGETVLASVDLTSLMKALKAIVEEQVYSRLVRTIITTAIEFAGAQRGVLLLRDVQNRLRVEAEASIDGGEPLILQSVPLGDSRSLSHSVVNYVARTLESVVIHDAQEACDEVPGLILDEHVRACQVRSVLCVPILTVAGGEHELIGMLYLENNRATHGFTGHRFGMLEIIGIAAAGRLELSRKAAVDGLTQLFNRDYFQSMFHQEMATTRRTGRALALIMADIDHFKSFNDQWGHQLGDQVLVSVAAAIDAACRETDIAARYGGEEMVVILPDTDTDGVWEVAERIRRNVEEIAIAHEAGMLQVTVSIGVAVVEDPTADEHELLARADAALYDAKSRGRNCVRFG